MRDGHDADFVTEIATFGESELFARGGVEPDLRQVGIPGQNLSSLPDAVIDIITRIILEHPEHGGREVEGDFTIIVSQRVGDATRRRAQDPVVDGTDSAGDRKGSHNPQNQCQHGDGQDQPAQHPAGERPPLRLACFQRGSIT